MDIEDKVFLTVLGVPFIVVMLFFLLMVFFSYDIKPYIQTYDDNFLPEYHVKMERKWGEDRTIFITINPEEAKDFYLDYK